MPARLDGAPVSEILASRLIQRADRERRLTQVEHAVWLWTALDDADAN